MEKENKNLEERILSLEQRVKLIEIKLEANKDSDKISVTKKLSVKEFLIEKKPDDDVKKTLGIAYFIECIENISTFNTDDLKKFYRLAKVPLPLNINDKVNMNVNNGHIMEAEEKKDAKKAWVLTATGEKFVENNFKDEK